jgi:hypothetical protein
MKTMMMTAAAVATLASTTQASLVAGDIAIVGFQASGAPSDSIAFAALTDLSAGTVIYFTDNGWTGSVFRGVTASDDDGNENLMKYTVGSNGLAAGTVISSLSTNSAYGQWTLSGDIGPGSGSYQQLSLSSTGDQVTAFISSNGTGPMLSGFTALWTFDNTGTFEDATSSGTGSLPTGLDSTTSTLLTGGKNYGVFNYASFSGAADAATWRARIADQSNWSTGTQTTDLSDRSFAIIPAPGAIALLGAAGLVGARRRRN